MEDTEEIKHSVNKKMKEYYHKNKKTKKKKKNVLKNIKNRKEKIK